MRTPTCPACGHPVHPYHKQEEWKGRVYHLHHLPMEAAHPAKKKPN